MSARVKPCCVVGCNNRETKRYVIVAEEKIRRIWLHRIRNPKLLTLDENQMKNIRICQSHFHQDCIEITGRLKRGSLPSINLPGYEEEDGNIFYKDSPKKSPKQLLLRNIEELGPTTSFGRSPKLNVTPPTRTYSKLRRTNLTIEFENSVSDTPDASNLPAATELGQTSENTPNESGLSSMEDPIRPERKSQSFTGGRQRIFSWCWVLRSLVLTNFMSSHSPNANCEEDDSCGALDNLKEFITSGSRTEIFYDTIPPVYPATQARKFDRKLDFATAYVAGYIGRKLMKKLSCDACANIFKSTVNLKQNILIRNKTYANCQMMHPSEFYLNIFHQLVSRIFNLLPTFIHSYKISEQLATRINIPSIQHLFCNSHESFSTFFIQKTIHFVIFFYIKKINKILKGTDLRHKNFDVVCNSAFQKYLKRRKK